MCRIVKTSIEKDIPVNLALRTMGWEPSLKRVVQITDGKVEINQEYENPKAQIWFFKL
jgi:hypothetical protein